MSQTWHITFRNGTDNRGLQTIRQARTIDHKRDLLPFVMAPTVGGFDPQIRQAGAIDKMHRQYNIVGLVANGCISHAGVWELLQTYPTEVRTFLSSNDRWLSGANRLRLSSADILMNTTTTTPVEVDR